MANEELVSLRLPRELLDRAEKLVPRLRKDEALSGFRISRSVVLRRALLVGIAQLERRYEHSEDPRRGPK